MVCQRSRGDRSGSSAARTKGSPPEQAKTKQRRSPVSIKPKAPPSKAKIQNKKKSLPKMKKQSPKHAVSVTVQDANTPAKIIQPLTKDSLAAMERSASSCSTTSRNHPHTTYQQSSPIAAVSVSEDSSCSGKSDASSGSDANCSGKSGASSTNNNYAASTFSTVISSDRQFVQASLQQRDDMERMRVARTLLYQAYVEALQSAAAAAASSSTGVGRR